MTKCNFKNIGQLELYMDKKIRTTIDRCAMLAMDRLAQNMIDSVYDWQPEQYSRTYQALEAISRTEVVKVYGKYVVEIYFDYKKMQPEIRSGSWNAHSDFWGEWINNEQSASDIINWLENGTDNKYYSHPAYVFIKETVQWLQKEYVKIFKAYARQNGMNLN